MFLEKIKNQQKFRKISLKEEKGETLIDYKPLILARDDSIHTAITKMIGEKKSCALIVNGDKEIVGILTERDIFRKIAGLELDERLIYKVCTIMTYPIRFCQDKDILPQVKDLHLNYGVRHFPILKVGALPHLENLVGMVSVTAIFKYLLSRSK